MFAQTVPRHTQRLYRLVDWAGADALGEQVAAIEEAIYQDAGDPLVNWDQETLAADLMAAGFADVALTADPGTEERRITPEQLDRWFGAGEADRPSYAGRLAAGGLSAAEVSAVRERYERQLTEQTVSWGSVTLVGVATVRG